MKGRSCMDRNLGWEFTDFLMEIFISVVFITIKATAKEKSSMRMLHTMKESGNWASLMDLVNLYGLMEKYTRDSIWKDLNMAKENLHSKTMVGTKASGKMGSNLEKVNTVKDMTVLKAHGKKVNLSDDQYNPIFAKLFIMHIYECLRNNQKRIIKKILNYVNSMSL